MLLKRSLNLHNLLKKKSFFLLGPRATGKTSLIRQELPGSVVYDLLHYPTFERLARRPQLIEEESGNAPLIVIDEIQRLPGLLNEAHRLIETRGTKFLLTGSSARKLRHGGANLLAGRAWEANLFPLTSNEITDFNLKRYLTVGGLPSVYLSDEPWEELKAYTGTYLREEIQAEALVRRFEAFARFLELVATRVGDELNLEAVGSDCGVNGKTIRNYLEIVNDTLIGFLLQPYSKTVRRKSTSRAKFYLFDIGVTNALIGRREIDENGEIFGRALEHLIALELRAFLSYTRSDEQLRFWRSQSKHEVDFIVGDRLAIEVKSTDLVNERHLKGLRVLREENLIERFIVVSRDINPREIDGITVLPWQIFLKHLWSGKLLSAKVQ